MSRFAFRRPLLRIFLMAALFVATDMVGAAGADGPPAMLDGTWRLVSVELAGEERRLDEDIRWLITKTQALYGGEPLATLTSYPTSTPPGIDLVFLEPRQEYEGIYMLEGDRLKVCLNLKTAGPKERPADFSTKEKPNLRVFLFSRVPIDDAPVPLKGFVGMALSLENGGQDVAIESVLEKSPAEKAGLKAGDVLVSIGDEKVSDLQGTVEAIRRKAPGSELQIRVRRDGNEKQIAVRVGVFPFSLLGLLG